ncbi:MAG: efflux RND transporter periplasmic adaptor subunit [Crocinitomicaceae bacterium]|nr:efflux RND transporter periplasmic adaptor subunit [Crocinitomicaceae bacterium]
MKRKLVGLFALSMALVSLNSCSVESTETELKEEKLNPLVTLHKAELKDFTHEIRVQGNVETDKDIIINAEMGGLITSIQVKEGQNVISGQTIATIDASILSSNAEELKTQLEYAEYMLDKQEELQKRGVGSEFDYETAQNQVNSLKTKMNSLNVQKGKAVIKAPYTGIVDNVFARNGQMAGPTSPIIRLVNNNTVDIVASISEKHISNIKVGTPIRVSFPNYNDTSINLNISNVGNYIEPTNRTFRIMSTINNNKLLLPNMLAEVSITDLEVKDGLVIPSKSLLKDQNNIDFVYTASKKGSEFVVSKTNVEVIEKFNGDALIKKGNIEPETMIVVNGAKGITEGDIVRTK